MRQHRHEWIGNRANDTLRHFRFAEIERRMHRSDDEIELRQNLIVEIERTVAQNIAFNSAENANVRQCALQFSNLRLLDLQPCGIESVRLHRAATVIGDPNIFEATSLRCCDHFLEAMSSVTAARMTMKRAAPVVQLE